MANKILRISRAAFEEMRAALIESKLPFYESPQGEIGLGSTLLAPLPSPAAPCGHSLADLSDADLSDADLSDADGKCYQCAKTASSA